MKLIKNGDYHKETPSWEIMHLGMIKARCMVCGAVYGATFEEYMNSSKNVSDIECDFCHHPKSVIFVKSNIAKCILNESSID